MQKRSFNPWVVVTTAILLLLLPIIAVGDSASSPTIIKYGELILGYSDPNGDGSTADATTGVLKLRNSGGTDVSFTVAELEVLATATDTALLYGNGTIWTKDVTNLNWDDTANSNELTLGSGTAAGTLELLEGSGGGTNTLGITAPATLAGDIEYVFPGTAIADKGIMFASAASTLSHDATNFSWDDTTNTNILTLGAGTGGGTLALLEGSGGGTDTVSLTAPATLAAAIEFTLPNALPARAQAPTISSTGAITYRPAKKVLYSATAASAAHTGATADATVVMPASADDPETVATSIGDANLQAGDVLEFLVVISASVAAAGNETLLTTVTFGSEEVGSTGALAIDQASRIFLTGTVQIRATGGSGTGYTSWTADLVDNTSGSGAPFVISTGDAQAFSSFDTTATQAFAVNLDWGGTTDGSDTSAVEQVILWHSAAD